MIEPKYDLVEDEHWSPDDLRNIKNMMRAYAKAPSLAEAPPPPKWMTVSTLLTTTTSLIAIGGAAFAVLHGYDQLGNRVQSFGERQLALDARVVVVETAFREKTQQRDQQLSAMREQNALQEVRLQNLTGALADERKLRAERESDIQREIMGQQAMINDLNKGMTEIRADLKVLVDRASRRGGLGSPQHDAQAIH